MAEVLSMHLKRDADAPTTLPTELKDHFHATDKTIQDLLSLLQKLHQDLKVNESSNRDGAERARIMAALGKIRRDLDARKSTVTRQQFKAFRDKWFKERPGEILRSQGSSEVEHDSSPEPLVSQNVQQRFRSDRRAVIEALYPEQGQPEVSRVVALERLIAYCSNNMGNLKLSDLHQNSQQPNMPSCSKKRPYKNQAGEVKKDPQSKSRRTSQSKNGWTEAETELLQQYSSILESPSSISEDFWDEILALLPGRTSRGIILQSYNLRKSGDGARKKFGTWSQTEIMILEQYSSKLASRSPMSIRDWQEILAQLPGRTRKAITKQSYKIRKKNDDDREKTYRWTEKEIEILMQHSKSLACPSSISDKKWLHILELLPGRTQQAIVCKSRKIRAASGKKMSEPEIESAELDRQKQVTAAIYIESDEDTRDSEMQIDVVESKALQLDHSRARHNVVILENEGEQTNEGWGNTRHVEEADISENWLSVGVEEDFLQIEDEWLQWKELDMGEE